MANGDVRMIERPNPPANFAEADGPEARSAKTTPIPESAGKAAGSAAKQPGRIDRAIQATRINRSST